MSEEIKEIVKDDDELLVLYKDNSFRTFDTLTVDVIDYITNLQQENQILKRNCNIGYEELNFYRKEYKKLKSVLDEIREYIENNNLINILNRNDLLEILEDKEVK